MVARYRGTTARDKDLADAAVLFGFLIFFKLFGLNLPGEIGWLILFGIYFLYHLINTFYPIVGYRMEKGSLNVDILGVRVAHWDIQKIKTIVLFYDYPKPAWKKDSMPLRERVKMTIVKESNPVSLPGDSKGKIIRVSVPSPEIRDFTLGKKGDLNFDFSIDAVLCLLEQNPQIKIYAFQTVYDVLSADDKLKFCIEES